jgi:hypothetical protein
MDRTVMHNAQCTMHNVHFDFLTLISLGLVPSAGPSETKSNNPFLTEIFHGISYRKVEMEEKYSQCDITPGPREINIQVGVESSSNHFI